MQAINPLNLKKNSNEIHTAAVCVYPARAKDAIDFLVKQDASYLPVASGKTFYFSTKNKDKKTKQIKLKIKRNCANVLFFF